MHADGFASKEQLADYFVAYAKQIKAPIRSDEEVLHMHRLRTIEALTVVTSTGAFQHPVLPAVVSEQSGLTQIHSSAYRNAAQLPKGAILAVSAGSTDLTTGRTK